MVSNMDEDYSKVMIEDTEDCIDPIHDIVDYLVRTAKVSFKNSHINEANVRTTEKIRVACQFYESSPTDFLLQFGKYLSPNHLQYFERSNNNENHTFKQCVAQLKLFHSDECRHKRIRNRRFKALQKLKEDTDYFSEKQMMYRNPLLYEQLVGQYLTDEEVQVRDAIDRDSQSFVSIILDSVDRNEMRETKTKQIVNEDLNSAECIDDVPKKETNDGFNCRKEKRWGDFDDPNSDTDYYTQHTEPRQQCMVNANERNLLREEFLQEMYCSFLEGRDVDFDYYTVDNNEEYDDLDQISRDAEDKYFDSEPNDVENLEEHMKLLQEYGKKHSNDSNSDPLDLFMHHIANKLHQLYWLLVLLLFFKVFK